MTRDNFSNQLQKRIRQLITQSKKKAITHPCMCVVFAEQAEELKRQLDNYRAFKGWN